MNNELNNNNVVQINDGQEYGAEVSEPILVNATELQDIDSNLVDDTDEIYEPSNEEDIIIAYTNLNTLVDVEETSAGDFYNEDVLNDEESLAKETTIDEVTDETGLEDEHEDEDTSEQTDVAENVTAPSVDVAEGPAVSSDASLQEEQEEGNLNFLYEHNGIKILKSPVGYLTRTGTKDGGYNTKQLTNFLIKPTLLINCDNDNQEYVVDVFYDGKVTKGRHVTVADLNSPNRLKEAIGIMGIAITGTSAEYNTFQMALRKEVEYTIVASEVLGLNSKGFLVPEGLITANGLVKNEMILIEKMGDSHSATYRIPISEKQNWEDAASGLLTLAPKINNRAKTLLILGWFMASLLKEYLYRSHNIKYPILEVYGTKGSGKTSSVTAMLKFFGHADPKGAPTDRAFPIFKRLAMTNALAVYLDEYRESLTNSADIKRIARNSYDRRDDSRGQASQNLIKYDLLAPMIVVGEDPMMDAACQERTISIALRRREQNVESFNELTRLPNTEYFLGGYMQWLLKNEEKWSMIFKKAEEIVDAIEYFPSDRVKKSATCITFGLLLVQELAGELELHNVYSATDISDALKVIPRENNNMFGDLTIDMMLNVRDDFSKILKSDEYLVEINSNGRMIGYFKQAPLIRSVVGFNKDSISTQSLVNKLHESAAEDGFIKNVNYLKSIRGKTMRTLIVDLTQLCDEHSDKFEVADFSDLIKSTTDDF